MSTVYGTTRATAIDMLNVVRITAQSGVALVGVVGKLVDTLDSKASDLHANVTHEAEEKRFAMIEYSMVEFDTNHAKRMVAARKEMEADPATKAEYLKLQAARQLRKDAAAKSAQSQD